MDGLGQYQVVVLCVQLRCLGQHFGHASQRVPDEAVVHASILNYYYSAGCATSCDFQIVFTAVSDSQSIFELLILQHEQLLWLVNCSLRPSFFPYFVGLCHAVIQPLGNCLLLSLFIFAHLFLVFSFILWTTAGQKPQNVLFIFLTCCQIIQLAFIKASATWWSFIIFSSAVQTHTFLVDKVVVDLDLQAVVWEPVVASNRAGSSTVAWWITRGFASALLGPRPGILTIRPRRRRCLLNSNVTACLISRQPRRRVLLECLYLFTKLLSIVSLWKIEFSYLFSLLSLVFHILFVLLFHLLPFFLDLAFLLSSFLLVS